ncbi:hypothetical protein LARI1_G004922 [Lachnellula arida]|uniref:Glycoside hydrolase 131 catalytic N-terminal domain-containing protein n=1 Tax=Lachnellula arida TaxID=1316785 RepID=A0A8T9B7L5_9HELO|nr:hypothetical protein LARI1_G004922 [Lachnellula arida]
MLKPLSLFGFAKLALGGAILWDGRFNDMNSSSELDSWSWSNQVGPYQYYIHGSENATSYVNLDPTFKNPADTVSTQGVKITLDSTSYWNGQTMRRTELIPQTSAAINSGKVYYHFSLQRTDTNAPSEFREHQIAFFESHFTELKSGWQSGASGTSDPLLRWDVSSTTQWNTTWEAGVWHNVAYGIDFSAGSVEFYHSTGADDLVLAHSAVSVSASSDGKDWHLGVLELPRDGYADATEDIYFSGVYVESGDLTTSVSGGAANSSSTSSASAASSSVDIGTVSTLATAVASTAPSTTASSTPIITSSAAEATAPASSEEDDDDDCE